MTATESAAPEHSGDRPAAIDGLAALVRTVGDREAIAVKAPFEGDAIGGVPACEPDDVEAAFDRAADSAWRETTAGERADALVRFHDLVLDDQAAIMDVVQAETGKARRDAHEEVLDIAATARYYAYRAASALETEPRRGALPGATETEVHHHPVGTVGIVSPWNYPLNLSVGDAIPALLAGNAVVLKPAPETPYTALKAAALLRKAGVPETAFQVLTGERATGEAVVEAADYVCFTGSTAGGRAVARSAGGTLTDCSLELGGKNPGIVRADADIERAVEGLLRGCFSNAGQLCLSIERLYVHADVFDRFVAAFCEAVESIDLGAGYEFDLGMGSLISAGHLEKVAGHVAEAEREGATVLTGGRKRPDVGPYFYEPTLLTGVEGSMALFNEETFGPVVSLYPYETDAEAIERANDSVYGLNASVWTDDTERGREIAAEIEAGTVNVNESYAAAWASLDAPMGGMKESGIGRRHGLEGLYRFTESQTVAVQKYGGLSPPTGVPYRLFARLLNGAMRVQRRLPWLR
ncbi:succinic semialdehyde dehydrogenase [Natronomonas sp.]|uniref:succinic semialdehyde dehydrogenase n=1 Tax=Natronomonas sp. TaxID=2184060 RepID=UPI0026326B10|nr:succinic semialdehyde dehydrogenase [Natronomonas sp.]